MPTVTKPTGDEKDTKPTGTTGSGKDNGKAAESKADKFRRVAGKRTAEALAAIEKIGATSRSTTYEYTDEQVDKITAALREQVDGVEKALKAHGGSGAGFEL
jgi:predicted amidohydrolase